MAAGLQSVIIPHITTTRLPTASFRKLCYACSVQTARPFARLFSCGNKGVAGGPHTKTVGALPTCVGLGFGRAVCGKIRGPWLRGGVELLMRCGTRILRGAG